MVLALVAEACSLLSSVLAAFQVTGPDCLLSWTWRHDFFFQLALPVAVLLVNSIQHAIVLVLSRLHISPTSKYRHVFGFLGVPSSQLPPESRHKELNAMRGDIFTKVISFTNIVYMTLVRYCVSAFVCMEIKDNLTVLRVYPDIECYTPLHRQTMAVAAIGTIVYVFGFPLAVLFSLYRIGSKQHHSVPSRLRKYGVVYDRYETHA